MTGPELGQSALESVFNAAPANFLLLDGSLTIMAATDAYLAATKTAREQVIGKGLFEIFPDNPEDPAADGVRNLKASLHRVIESGRADRMPVQKYDIRRPEDEGGGFEERYWSPLNVPVLTDSGVVSYIIHSVEDVTEIIRLQREARHEQALLHEELRSRDGRIAEETYLRTSAVEANRRLSESERRYRFLTDAVPQLIWTADGDGAFDYVNERWSTFTGRPAGELRGDGWLTSLHPDDREKVANAWKDAVHAAPDRFQSEFRLQDGTGAWRWVMSIALPWRDTHGNIQQWYGATTDIHERVSAEEQLRSAQRLQALGKLAGGMAHEVNNMMTAVIGFGELVSAGLGEQHPEFADIQEMVKAAARAAEVTRQLLAFSRQQVLLLKVIDLCTVAIELKSLLQRIIGSDRRLDVKLNVPELRVHADRNQIEQVLINLVANARDATSTNGVITIELDSVAPSLSAATSHSSKPPARLARLTVRDDGTGMAPEVAARVFEPFFTTKDVGRGTGLGLSMVLGIVEQSGGVIRVESAVGAGTAFVIDLPVVDAALTTSVTTASAPRGEGQRILVVEDESVVRSMTRRTLAAAGYDVAVAPNGSVALEFLQAHAGKVDLVLTDVVMPNMNGLQLAQRMREQHPQVPVIYMSAYTGDEIMQRGLSLSDVPLVQKPFTRDVLLATVGRTLGQFNKGGRSDT